MKSLILRRVPMKMIRIGTLFLAGTFASPALRAAR